MLLIVYLLFLSGTHCAKKGTTQEVAVASNDIDPINDEWKIDKQWLSLIITAPTSINLLGQIMVVASKNDVSFEKYANKHVYKYIKYPKSFRATMFQIASEGSNAFRGAHKSMNQIRLNMRQIPSHMKTIVKILEVNASAKFTKRMVTSSMGNIERISKTCVELAVNSENSFQNVLNLMDEVIAITLLTQGLHETDLREKEIQLNLTRTLQTELKKENEERSRYYNDIRESVRKAQDDYSQALKDIPTGFKALCLDLGRAAISALKMFVAVKAAGPLAVLIPQKTSSGGSTFGAQSYGSEQALNYVTGFIQSINSLINKLSSVGEENVPSDELKSYKIVFRTFNSMINSLPKNPTKEKASALIERASDSIDTLIDNSNATILDELKAISNDAKPLLAAQQLSQSNTQAISAESGETDSSQNELFKARIAQNRLAQVEQRLDAYHGTYMQAMEQMRIITSKLVQTDIEVFDLRKIIELLKDAFILLGQLREHWYKLVQFFTDFSVQVGTGFKENVVPYLDTLRNSLADAETLSVNRKIILDLLNGDNSVNLYREAYFLYSLSRTYFEVSSNYLLPRLGPLAKLLAAPTDDERVRLLQQLSDDITTVQDEVKELVEKRKQHYEELISAKHAEINKSIDKGGADGSEEDDIEKAKSFQINDDFSKEKDD